MNLIKHTEKTSLLVTLLRLGAHFGHRYHKWNPKMLPFIYGIRHNTHIINLENTTIALRNSLEIVSNVIKQNGTILFVSARPDMSNIIENVAKETNQFFVTKKWIGGLLTNWFTIKNNFNITINQSTKNYFYSFLKLRRDDKKIDKVYSGIRHMDKLPDLIIVTDVKSTKYCLAEAKLLNIPTIGLIDTINDPSLVTYPIPINTESVQVVYFFLQLIQKTINASTIK